MASAPSSFLAASLLVAAVVLAACKPGDRAAGNTASSPSARNGPSAATAASASGARAAGLNDSISERADRGRIQGSESATVWFIESSDFQCPFCKTFHDSTYRAIVRDYVQTGKIRMAYLNFPLNIHQNARPAAEAAMCASVQGKFWEMHDALFESQQRWAQLPDPTPVFDSLATARAVAMPAWRDCVAKHLTRPIIDADAARSERAGVQSTPSFFVGDQAIAGAEPYPRFRDAIERALAKARGARPAQ
jgi:protein-disulfide isomerase